MYLSELLELGGLDPKAKVKMVPHPDGRHDLYELMTSGLIEFLNGERFSQQARLEKALLNHLAGVARGSF